MAPVNVSPNSIVEQQILKISSLIVNHDVEGLLKTIIDIHNKYGNTDKSKSILAYENFRNTFIKKFDFVENIQNII